MSQIRKNVTIRLDTFFEEKLKEYSHSMGLQLPEMIEIISTIFAIQVETNEMYKKLAEDIIREYKKKEQLQRYSQT